MTRAARRAALVGLLLGSCFEGQALWGERCAGDADCGPSLRCGADGFCAAAECAALQFRRDDPRPKVVFLLDHSESMKRCLDDPDERTACFEEGATEPSRWDALGQLVRPIVAQLADRVDFAAVLFPSDDDPFALTNGFACRFNPDETIGLGASPGDIDAAIPSDRDREPIGDNPVRIAWDDASEHLLPWAGTTTPRLVVLITDNPPNCRDGVTDPVPATEKLDDMLAPTVAAGATAGLRTLVVGLSIPDALADASAGDGKIDDVNPDTYMRALAEAGGAPQPGPSPYLHVRTTADLAAVGQALAEVIDGLTDDVDTCRIALESAPADPARVAVALDGWARHADPTCENEPTWRWAEGDPAALVLCPVACAQLAAAAAIRVFDDCG